MEPPEGEAAEDVEAEPDLEGGADDDGEGADVRPGNIGAENQLRLDVSREELIGLLQTDPERGRGLPTCLILAIGCRVSLTRNLCTRLGVVNGALGTVVGFRYYGGQGDYRPPTEQELSLRACSLMDATAKIPPPLPVVLVDLDKYNGASFAPHLGPCVIPVCPVQCQTRYGGRKFTNCHLHSLKLSLSTSLLKVKVSVRLSLTLKVFLRREWPTLQ